MCDGWADIYTWNEEALKEASADIYDRLDSLVRLLPITSCYQCYDRDTDKCICNKTGKIHPPPWSIPDWCPLKPNDKVSLNEWSE